MLSVGEGQVLVSTLLRYDHPLARPVWAMIAPIHRAVARRLLSGGEDAADAVVGGGPAGSNRNVIPLRFVQRARAALCLSSPCQHSHRYTVTGRAAAAIKEAVTRSAASVACRLGPTTTRPA